jgi:A/G-specific adenine glycosylase
LIVYPSMVDPDITKAILSWYQTHGRHDLPWQKPITPYRVWLSETMLQQTQVATVIEYFNRFVTQLPTVTALAESSLDDVMALWSGLGYYRRARFLHSAAQLMVDKHKGNLPSDYDALLALPGVGRSTAGAILSIAFQKPYPILDGNVKRVMCRLFAIEGWPDAPVTQKKLWPLAQSLTPQQGCHHYAQAIMDLGATVCTKQAPQCHCCPINDHCSALKHGLIEQLPEKKPKRTIPEKAIHFFVLVDECNRVLMIKRGESGIWANMWAFPDHFNDNLHDVLDELGVDPALVVSTQTLAPFKHALTHFRLTIHTKVIKLDNKNIRTPGAWYNIDAGKALGIPKPVKTILGQLSN